MFPVLETLARCVQPEAGVRVSPNPESTYMPMASSLPAPVAGVAPELTEVAAPVVPVACAIWSTTEASGAVERPAYSDTTAPTSAVEVGLTVIVGRVPPPTVIGALHTLISVCSEAWKCRSSTYALPAESVTLAAVAPALLQTPTSTTSRLPWVTLAAGVSVSEATADRWAETCWMNAGALPAAPGRPRPGAGEPPRPPAGCGSQSLNARPPEAPAASAGRRPTRPLPGGRCRGPPHAAASRHVGCRGLSQAARARA